jgi:hypothetical protein
MGWLPGTLLLLGSAVRGCSHGASRPSAAEACVYHSSLAFSSLQ